jgi:hypothetical protein
MSNMARFEWGKTKLGRLPRRPMIAGAGSGVLAGIAVGLFAGPAGVAIGMWLGFTVGFVAGMVLAHEDDTRTRRTQELDAIIGITHGSMGAPPGSIPPRPIAAAELEDEDAPQLSTKEAWLAEWLTPPPPSVAG